MFFPTLALPTVGLKIGRTSRRGQPRRLDVRPGDTKAQGPALL